MAEPAREWSPFTTYFHLGMGGVSYLVCIATLFHCAQFLFQTKLEIVDRDHRGNEIFVDLLLIAAFVIPHTLLASPTVKRFWKDHPTISFLQRSTYVLITALTLELLVAHWRTIPVHIWKLSQQWEQRLFILTCAAWFLIVLQTLLVDPLELIGLKQIWYASRGWGNPIDSKSEGIKKMYQHMRHPVALGFAVVLWVTPVMTLDRLCLALSLTIYLLFGNHVDEDDIEYVEAQLKMRMSNILKSKPE
eukprot:TRINITY_DN11584_c0_g1_i1.p1 TRINITY_DN11584_c0_g1~~TRINITY_DN11584_c0_g1_i1.p1  ORF type:complete len:247 (+),score=49.11 TRINITY_DN11584_c0_g1_i1:86-826(+)